MTLRDKVIEVLSKNPQGMTQTELCDATGVNNNTCHSCVATMLKQGTLRRCGGRRVVVTARSGEKRKLTITLYTLASAPVTENEKVVNADAHLRSSELWADIRERILRHVLFNKEDIDAGELHKFYLEFETDMRESAHRFVQNVRRAPQDLVRKDVPRRVLAAACRTLRIKTPSVGKEADQVMAKKNKRILVRTCHPDVLGSSSNEHTRAMYQAVVEAFDLIVRYNQQLIQGADHDKEQQA